MDQKPSSHLAAVQDTLRAGDLTGARVAVEAWLEEFPDNVEALYFSAVIDRSSDRPDDALATLDQALTLDPMHSRALQECGHIRRRQGQLPEALNDYQRATRLNPSLLASWQGQAQILEALGHKAAARQAAEQTGYLQSLPPPLVVVMDLVARGRLGKAEDLCKRFMQKNPQHVEGMRLLADIASRLGALDEATLLLDTAEVLAPLNHRVTIDYIQLLRRAHRFEDALSRAEALVAKDPNNPQYRSLAAVEALQVGRYDEALDGFDAVLAQVPGDPVTLTSKGHALKTCGRTDDAIGCYREAIASQTSYGEAWYSLANLKTYRFSSGDVARMEELVGASSLEHGSRVFLHFALGKAYEDSENYRRAFQHYSAGNRAKKQQSSYDAARISDEFERQRRVCTPELFRQADGSGCPAPDPIFIVGLPRAGSTLLEQILASHSQVDGTLELPNVLSLAQQLRRRSETAPYPEILATLGPDELRAFGEDYIRNTRIHRAGAPLFIDKMPNNFRHIGLIKLMLPNAKIIDARRNPMACCFSGYKQLFAEGQEFSYSLTDIGRYYRDYVALMEHWNQVLPGEILQVNNEDIIANLETEIRRILDFCGLPFEEACLRYWETERAVKTPSSEQVRKPVSDVGQHQWRHFAPWLEDLTDALGPELTALSI